MTGVENLSPSKFLAGFQNDPESVILDVRTPEEFSEKRIEGAINIDIYSHDFQAEITGLDKSKSYYVYCRSGSRSFHAGLFMAQQGFKKVFNLDGGIIGWSYDVVRGE